MELNKFEENAREKLGKRQIKPSTGTWEKLDAKLNTEENKTSQKPWKYIAAAAAVLLITGTFMLNNDFSESPQIVEEPVNEMIEKPEVKQEFSKETNTHIASEESKKEEENSAENNSKNEIVTTVKPSVKEENTSKISVSEENKYEEAVALETISLEPPVSEKKLIQSKLEEVIAAAAKNDEISEDEVDALLAQAASEISRERNSQFYNSNTEISANALLAEVEDEIYQSFKAKVFEVLKEGYLKAKTAVANRNY